MSIKYKVVFNDNGKWAEMAFSSLKCAYECAERVNGIVLNAK